VQYRLFWVSACSTVVGSLYMKLSIKVPSNCPQPNIPVATPAQLISGIEHIDTLSNAGQVTTQYAVASVHDPLIMYSMKAFGEYTEF
jgi:hypothetical protein